jgi:hypothetical protein
MTFNKISYRTDIKPTSLDLMGNYELEITTTIENLALGNV